MTRFTPAVVACAIVASIAAAAQQAPLSRSEGDSMERKLNAITERGGAAPDAASARIKTTFTDRELNAYLTYNGQQRLPVGLREPSVTFPSVNRFDGRALVDLDQIRKSKEYGGFTGLFLQGTHEVKLSGTFSGANGKGTVHLLSALIDGVPAQGLVEVLVGSFSKSPDLPGGFQLDKPFDLPSRIRTLQVQSGSITVIQ